MTYQVPYRADVWRAQIRRFPLTVGWCVECQVVEQELGNHRRLYVELIRYPSQSIQVTVARIEATASSGAGVRRRRTITYLQPDDLVLVEVAGENHRA